MYEQLAVSVGTAAGLPAPVTAQAVAENADARADRDLLWFEYERMLADEQTYTLAGIQAWLVEKASLAVSETTVHRNRVRIRERRRRQELANARTAEVVESLEGLSQGDLLDAAAKKTLQITLEWLMKYASADALEELKPGQIIAAFDMVGRLKREHAETGLLTEKLAAMRRDFQARAKTAGIKAGDGRLSQEDVDEISEAVFGPGR